MLILLIALVFVVIAGGLAMLGLGVIGTAGSSRSQVEASLSHIAGLQAPAAAPRGAMANEEDDAFKARVLIPAWNRMLELGKRLTPPERRARLRSKLDLAGHPYGWDVDRIIGLKVCLGIAGLALGFLLPAMIAAWVPMLVILPGFAALGFYAPDFAVYQAAYNRTEQIQDDLPDALDLLTVSVESGLAFDGALQQVARNTTGPLADEFARVLKEMQIGTGRADALRALGERTNVEELQRFCSAMVQADKLGVPISRVLRVQAQEMRTKRSQRAEEKAQKVPVKILFPLICCIMPALFIVIIGPAAIQIMENLGGMG